MMHAFYAWCARHPEAVATFVITVAIAVWKRLPPATRAAVERRSPRLVNAIRVGYALFPDVVKAVAATRAMVQRQPKEPDSEPAPPPVAPLPAELAVIAVRVAPPADAPPANGAEAHAGESSSNGAIRQ